MLEEAINALTAQLASFKKSTDERLDQIETTPAQKVTEGPTEVSKAVERFEKLLKETGDVNAAMREVDKAYNIGKTGGLIA
jgi:hypothetical protein